MILLSHPTGNSFVRSALDAFYDEGLLEQFFTTVATFDGQIFDVLSKIRLAPEFERRRYRGDLASLTTQQPLRELLRLISFKLNLREVTRSEKGSFCIDRVYHELDLKVARALKDGDFHPSAVYAYEDGARETFEFAKKAGINCIYDLPIGYWRAARRIQAEEAEINPEWAMTMSALGDSENKLRRKDEELANADSIVVASQFTASTIREAPFDVEDVHVVPYGTPERTLWPTASSNANGNGRLKVLFVGGLSQRKGVSYLLDAVESLGKSVELTIIGRTPAETCPPLENALNEHRWVQSLPHEGILEEMSQHDVLVFPSLFEGFGLVVTEALTMGLPVITTAHTCGPDILTEGEDGFVVPIRDSQAIAEKLELLNSDRDLLKEMSEKAKNKATRLTWEKYRQDLVKAIGPYAIR
ncbi:MAG: glycosyltransferase family 4 protein [Verrucomicrobiota bacterium JB023]|nr:glycosyltransferase family 4 protein [Verrucomicrobiota bacterium JB023]